MNTQTFLMVIAIAASGCGRKGRSGPGNDPTPPVAQQATQDTKDNGKKVVSPAVPAEDIGSSKDYGAEIAVNTVQAGNYQLSFTVFKPQKDPISFTPKTILDRNALVPSLGLALAEGSKTLRIFFELYPDLNCTDANSLLAANGTIKSSHRADGSDIHYSVKNDTSDGLQNLAQVIALLPADQSQCTALAFYSILPADVRLNVTGNSHSAAVISTVINSIHKMPI